MASRLVFLGVVAIVLTSIAAAGAPAPKEEVFIGSRATSFGSGNSLLDDCKAGPGTSDLGFCLGMVAGAVSALDGRAHRFSTSVGGQTVYNFRACIPNEVTLGQTKDIAIKWLTEHPENRQQAAINEVQLAVSNAFPC